MKKLSTKSQDNTKHLNELRAVLPLISISLFKLHVQFSFIQTPFKYPVNFLVNIDFFFFFHNFILSNQLYIFWEKN